MKPLYYILSILLITIGLSLGNEAKASHAVGADLSYECLGNNQYRITLTFYRDCAGISYPSSASVSIRSNSCNRSFSQTLSRQGSPTILQTVCGSQSTTCNGGSFPGIQQVTYSAVVTMPAQCNDWIISYSLCCRNSAIDNLSSPGSQNLYVEALLNNANGLCNNSPVFSTLPVPFVCRNQLTFYNHGGIDFDGDDLTFELINPLTGSNNNIPYRAGYNINNPIRNSGGFGFDQVTGQMTFTPTQLENAVITVKVTERRNGQVIGYTMRDIQVIVVNCGNNTAPNISGVNGTGFNGQPAQYQVNVCTGNSICFDMEFADPNSTDILTITPSNLPTGATFTLNGQTDATFCWTPTAADVGNNTFLVTVRDDACPIPGQSVQAFNINVAPAAFTVNSNSTPATCPGGSDGSASVIVSGAAVPPITYNWSTGATTSSINNVQAGNYTVTISDANSCPQVETVTVFEPPAFVINFSTTPAQCNGTGDGTATALATGGTSAGGVYDYMWNVSAPDQDSTTISNLSSGSYVVTITDDVGCDFTDSVFVFQPGPLVINLTAVSTISYNGADISCAGASDGQVAAIATGGTLPYNYVWSPNSGGQSTDTIYNLGPGTYSVTLTDANGCNTGTTVSITEPDSLGASGFVTSNYNGSDISCFGANDGEARVNATGGTGAYSYDWGALSGNQTTRDATNLPGGQYVVTVTDVNGCIDTAVVDVVEPDELIVNAFPVATVNGFNLSCNGTTDGAAQAFATGGTTPQVYRWNDPLQQPFAVASDLAAGTYQVTVTDINGCFDIDTVTLLEPPPLVLNIAVTSNYNGSEVSCFGASDGEATVTPVGGVAPYDYQWNDPAQQTTAVAGGLSANTQYVVVVTDSNECVDSIPITLTEPDSISGVTSVVSNYNGQDVSCFSFTDGSADVTPSGGTPGYSYQWDASAANQATQVAGNLGAGTYTVTVTDLNGCNNSFDVTLTEPAALVGGANVQTNYNGSDISCFGADDATIRSTPSGGTPGYNYQWSANASGAITQTVPSLGPGSYDVTVTDINGCTVQSNVVVTEPAAIVPTASATTNFNGYEVSCFGLTDGATTVNVVGGTPGFTYNWNDNQNQQTQNASNLAAGTYVIEVTDTNGCNAFDTITLTQPTQVVATASITSNFGGSDVSCFGATDGEATGVGNGGVTPYQYNWDPSNQSTATATGLGANVTYTVVVTDLNGCEDSADVTLSEPPQITATTTVITDYNGWDVSCFGSTDGGASVRANGGTQPFTFQWDAAAGGSVAPTAYGLAAGTYNVVVTDANGCTVTEPVTLTEPTELTAQTNALAEPSCYGLNDGQGEVVPTGGTPGYTYQWDAGAGYQRTPQANSLGAGTYDVTVTDLNGCLVTTTLVLDQPDSIYSSIDVTEVICNGDNNGILTVNPYGGTPGYTYNWNSNPAQSTSSAVNLYAGNYTVTITDANGCTATKNATLTEPLVLRPTATGVDPGCYGAADGSALVEVRGGEPGYTYAWSDASGQTTEDASGLTAGIYYISVTDARGCVRVDSVLLVDPAETSVNIIPDSTIIPFGGSVDLTTSYVTIAPAFVDYEWSGGDGLDCYDCPDPVASPIYDATYTLLFTDDNGCTATDQVLVKIDPLSRILYIPNAFSPNGDGVNELFTVYGKGISEIKLMIFDRWGEKVFETSDPNFGWDGTKSGEVMTPGVFVYHAVITYVDGFTVEEEGSVTLLR